MSKLLQCVYYSFASEERKAVRVALLRRQRGWKARRLDEPGYSKAVAVASRERE